jgi:hypothetical protein
VLARGGPASARASLQVRMLFHRACAHQKVARVAPIHTRVLASLSSRVRGKRSRAHSFVARVGLRDALWVREHTVMYVREIHHIAVGLG